MAIGIEQGGGTPFAKFQNLGDKLIGAFGSNPKECTRQARNFDTGAPAVKEDGKPRLEEVMHFVAMPGTTAMIGDPDKGYEAINPGDHVRFSVSGFKWGQVIDARKALPAHAGFKAGQVCSGDVYEITLAGWSAETKNPAGATKAGFHVVEGRVVLASQDDKDRWVLAQSRNGGNTNPAKDYVVTIRRPGPTDKAWEQAADEMYLAKPWLKTPVTVGGGEQTTTDDEEPF